MGPSPLTLSRDNTDVLIDNTVAETTLFSYTIPAYTLDGDRGLRVTIQGQAHSDGVADPLGTTIRVKLGTTTLITGSLDISMFNTDVHNWSMTLEVMAKNSDAAQEVFGQFVMGMNLTPHNFAVSDAKNAFYAESTEDGTTDIDLVVSVEMDTADPDCWWSHQRSIVELL